MKTVRFLDHDCTIEFSKYANGRTAITLMCEPDGYPEPMCTVTTNLPMEPLPEGHVFIKNWQENQGVLEALAEAGVVRDTGQTRLTGWARANVCELLYRGEGT